MRSLAALLGLYPIPTMDTDLLVNPAPTTHTETVKQTILAWSCSSIGVAGTGALIYGFYCLCIAYYVKMNVFYSAAITVLR